MIVAPRPLWAAALAATFSFGLGTGGLGIARAQPAPTPPAAPAVGAAPAAPSGYYHYDQATDPNEQVIELHGGPTPELHVVTRGDTLWAICWYYFNDPWQWPKVWAYNPQITNPHWIYPGDLVRLLPKGFISAVTGTIDPQLDPDDTSAGDPEVAAPTPQRAVTVNVRQVAFIDKQHLDSAWRVVGAVDERELLSTGDDIYISYPQNDVPQLGKRYSIYATDRPVEHPTSGATIGSYVRVLGEVEIIAVKKDKQATARVVNASGEIERGARVGPLLTQFKNVPPVKNAVDATGTVVAMLGREQLIGEGEVVFLDVGKAAGVAVGNRMYVVRRGDAYEPERQPEEMVGQNNQRFPARALGEIVLIQVDERLSIGLVTLAIEEMGIGDRVMMRKQ